LLVALGVFRGGFTLAAAHAVCAPEGCSDAELLDMLTVLIDHSLIDRFPDPEETEVVGRFWMLETIREYAAERLRASGTGEMVAARHAA
jgi:predicted ATPase